MRVAVVGAGLAGLAAARELRAGGPRGAGGREEPRPGRPARGAARRGDRARPRQPGDRGARPARRCAAWPTRCPPTTASTLEDGIAYRSGATRLPKLIAEGLEVVAGVRLAALREVAGGPRAGRRAGQHPRRGRRRRGHRAGPPGGRPAGAQPRAAAPRRRAARAGLRARRDGAGGRAARRVRPAGPSRGRTAGRWPRCAARRPRGGSRSGGVAPFVARLAPAESAALLDASDEAALERALPALAALLGPAAAEPGVGPGQALALRGPGAAGSTPRRSTRPARAWWWRATR